MGEALPTIDVPHKELTRGVPAFEILLRSGLCASAGEARRLIRGGGGRVNDAVVASELAEITIDDLNSEGVIKVSAGKKRHALIRPA